MNKGTQAGLGLGAAGLITGVAMLTTFGGADSASAQDAGPGGGITTDAPVPGWVRELINKNAGKCPQVTASLLAAQLFTESGFNSGAVSPVGALGIAQFMPATWADQGRDGNGDGVKDARNPADAIAAQAEYDCTLAAEVKKVPGDSTDNMLAAYNAGGPAVIKYNGIPPYSETREYVRKIRALASKWADAVRPDAPAGKGPARAITAAKTALGSWYQWGGSCAMPFKGMGGCDCSSLTKMAWSAAGVNLPRTTYDQVHAGTAVNAVSQLRPGDLLFTVPGRAGPEHVGMYIGNGQVIDAPHTGAQVRIKPLSYWKPQIIAMRHVG
ncbi:MULTISPECIES: bifunctional lytic transglycosylase/C40 family peptidase [unclassified Streptomyces]|uniref:bifunctional lytic transglycosylase/C40 family peptidase n=1 Tax=unclassified Streptomyces TaxID=2593676 RepID=UPI000823B2BF|nr:MULTISPECIES: bifunctional lytic transglycosylase/C40 family peptidase [unclassified Streptomyces]MYU02182.1 transglycosylase SLT domain-containing protein [Streptomyces sp. SID8350]SCK61762.1 Cell wall-associated hydrolases (invasion-associated proteins) [Streptomyces sp. AmelKG-D3]